MPGMKGITVRIDADLHAEIKAYLEENGMTMGDFIALAAQDELHPRSPELDPELQAEVNARLEGSEMTAGEFINLAVKHELHPKIPEMEVNSMERENTRTLAFQVPESLYQRVNAYKQRHQITLRRFVLGLIEEELENDEDLVRKQQEGTRAAAEEEQDEGLSEAGEAPVSEDDPEVEQGDEPEETAAVGDFEGGFDEPDEDEMEQHFTEIEDGSFPEEEAPDEGISEAGEAHVSEDGPKVEQGDEPEETAGVGDFEGSSGELDEDEPRAAVEVAPMPDFDEEDGPSFPELDNEEDQDYGMSMGY